MKYLLDTNVVSEIMKAAAEEAVLRWMQQNQHLSAVSALTVAEIEKGIALLAPGQRKERLREAWHEFAPIVEDQVLAFDLPIARRWGKLAAELKRLGRLTPVLDCMIEATALHWELTVVTRNTSDFTQAATLNPWPA